MAVSNINSTIQSAVITLPAADASIKNNKGLNALHAACAAGRISAVTQILERWPYLVNVATDSGTLPIGIAAASGNMSMVKALMDKQDPTVSIII
jgi:ankyrin repeat protein